MPRSSVGYGNKIDIKDYNHSYELLKYCSVGDKFWRPGEKRCYKVSRVSPRFVVIRKHQFKTYVYSIIDLEKEYMGPHDWLFRDEDMRTKEGCESIMSDMVAGSMTHISGRHGCKLIKFTSYQPIVQ